MSVGSDFHLSLHPSSSLLSLSVGMAPCPRGKHRGTRTRPGSTHRAAAAGAVSRVLGSLRPATAPAPTQAAGRVTKTRRTAPRGCVCRDCVSRPCAIMRPRQTHPDRELVPITGRALQNCRGQGARRTARSCCRLVDVNGTRHAGGSCDPGLDPGLWRGVGRGGGQERELDIEGSLNTNCGVGNRSGSMFSDSFTVVVFTVVLCTLNTLGVKSHSQMLQERTRAHPRAENTGFSKTVTAKRSKRFSFIDNPLPANDAIFF